MRNGSWLQIGSVLVYLMSLWKAWYLFGWVGLLGVGIAGFFVAFLASTLLRWYVQIPAVIAVVVGGIASLLLGAEVASGR